MKNQNYYRVLTYLFAAGTLIGIIFAAWAVSMLPEQVNPWGRTTEQIADFLEAKPVGTAVVGGDDTQGLFVKERDGGWSIKGAQPTIGSYFLGSYMVRVLPEHKDNQIFYVVYQPGETWLGLPK